MEFMKTSNPDDFEIVDGELRNYKGDARDVVVPDNVTSISSAAFSDCDKLTRLTLGRNVKYIEDEAFLTCCKLIEVFNKSPYITVNLGDDDENGYVACYAKNVYTPTRGIGGTFSADYNGCLIYDIGEDKILIDYLGENTYLILPGGITEINRFAFDCNEDLTNVVIPDSVTTIGPWAFTGCSGLMDLDIPDSVTSIGDDAFSGCDGLTSIIVGRGLTSIDPFDFSDCINLKRVVFRDCQGWYEVTDYQQWQNKTSGKKIDLSNPQKNAKYLRNPKTFFGKRKRIYLYKK